MAKLCAQRRPRLHRLIGLLAASKLNVVDLLPCVRYKILQEGEGPSSHEVDVA